MAKYEIVPADNTRTIVKKDFIPIPIQRGQNYRKASLPANTVNILSNTQNAKHNFAVVNKDVDSIYYFNPKKELLAREPVITGRDDGMKNDALTMREFFENENTSDHGAYFNYLDRTKQKITPKGVFQISRLRENTADNPQAAYHPSRVYNFLFRPEREELIRKNRLKDYGSQQKIFTLMDAHGVGIGSAIHGTDNPEREAVFNDPNAKHCDRNMSNGCMNVKDDSKAFNILQKGSKVIVGNVTGKIDLSPEFKFSPNNSFKSKLKRNYKAILKDSGIETSDDKLNYLVTTALKETQGGRSYLSKFESFLPYSIFGSQGDFEINPKSFKKYLPKNYSGDLKDQLIAVSNFYDEHAELPDISKYQTYNRGRILKYPRLVDRKFVNMLKGVKRISE